MMRKSLVLLGLALLTAAVAGAEEMTAEQVLDKMVEARGGADAIAAVKDIKMTAKMSGPMTGGMELPMSIEGKRPDKVRIEFTFQGMTGVQAFDGTTGWHIMPFMGKTEPEAMSPEQLEQIRDQADFDGVLIDYESKGHSVKLIGTEDLDGRTSYKIEMTKKDGDVEYHFIDAERFLPVLTTGSVNFQGVETEYQAFIGDYRESGGVLWAHSIDQRAKGAPEGQLIVIEEILVNAGIPDERFAMPEPAPEPEPDSEVEVEAGAEAEEEDE